MRKSSKTRNLETTTSISRGDLFEADPAHLDATTPTGVSWRTLATASAATAATLATEAELADFLATDVAQDSSIADVTHSTEAHRLACALM